MICHNARITNKRLESQVNDEMEGFCEYAAPFFYLALIAAISLFIWVAVDFYQSVESYKKSEQTFVQCLNGQIVVDGDTTFQCSSKKLPLIKGLK